MLKGIHPSISPELLKVLAEMGHGDEIVISDANFPAGTLNSRVLRADGIGVPALLEGIMPLFDLDTYEPCLLMMQAVQGDSLDVTVEERYMSTIRRHAPEAPSPLRLSRQDFYARTRAAFAVVVTSERVKYGNILLKKGVTLVG